MKYFCTSLNLNNNIYAGEFEMFLYVPCWQAIYSLLLLPLLASTIQSVAQHWQAVYTYIPK
jgi:hypothetical protein